MTTKQTMHTADDVRRIRALLGWSQDELARHLGLQVTTVREWERGGNPCKGPAALLLALLERRPDVLSILDRDHHGLPSPHAVEGSVEWFQLQRLLALLARVANWGEMYWAGLVATERLHRVWLQEMETALLLEPVRRHSAHSDPEMRTTTKAGELRYQLEAWERWVEETQPAAREFFWGGRNLSDTTPPPPIGLMDSELLARFTSAQP